MDVAAVLGRAAVGEVAAVYADLDGPGVADRQAAALEDGASGKLHPGILRIEIDGRDVLPRPVRREVHAVVIRPSGSRAVAAVAHADTVTHLCVHAVDADERGVHLGVAVGFTAGGADSIEFGTLDFRHDDVIEGLGARLCRGRLVKVIIDQVNSVASLLQYAVDVHRGRPHAGVAGGIGRLDVKLDDRVVRLRRNLTRENAVAGDLIAVEPVVGHPGGLEDRLTVSSIAQADSKSDGLFINDARRHRDGIGRSRNGGPMLRIDDHGRDVPCRLAGGHALPV